MLNGKQRAALRAMANGIEPCFQIGKGGLGENQTAAVSDALEAKELIKINVLKTAGASAKDIAQALSQKLEAEAVSVVGNKIVLYRKSGRGDVEHILI